MTSNPNVHYTCVIPDRGGDRGHADRLAVTGLIFNGGRWADVPGHYPTLSTVTLKLV
jgi:hypothetical protein